MKAAVIFVALAACGHAAPALAPIANRGPDPIDEAPAQADAAGDDCSRSAAITVHVAGRDESALLETCIDPEEHEHGEGWVSHDARADLLLDRDPPVTILVAEWETNMEETPRSDLVGALRSKSGEDTVLVLDQGSGTAEGIAGEGAALLVYAVRGGAWEKVHELDANLIELNVAADRSVVTVETCDAAPGGPGAGSGGGACENEGDGKTIELRWDGNTVDGHELAP